MDFSFAMDGNALMALLVLLAVVLILREVAIIYADRRWLQDADLDYYERFGLDDRLDRIEDRLEGIEDQLEDDAYGQ